MKIAYCLLSVSLTVLVACEGPPTSVRLQAKDGVVFDIRGGGRLNELKVFGPEYFEQATSPNDKKFLVWMIQPAEGYGRLLRDIGTVRYGVVPTGYVQVFPENRNAPPPLVPAKPYLMRVETFNANGFSGVFEVLDRSVTFVDVQAPCFQDDHGRWKRVASSECAGPSERGTPFSRK